MPFRLLAALALLIVAAPVGAQQAFRLTDPVLIVDGTRIEQSGLVLSQPQFRYLTIVAPGYGRFTVSDRPFPGAVRAGDFDGSVLALTVEGRSVRLRGGESMLATRAVVPAYARFEADGRGRVDPTTLRFAVAGDAPAGEAVAGRREIRATGRGLNPDPAVRAAAADNATSARLSAQIERLDAEVARLRAEAGQRNTRASEAATLRADAEALRAERDRLRLDLATRETEAARLRAEVARREGRAAEAATLRADADALRLERDRLREDLAVRETEMARLRADAATRTTQTTDSAVLMSERDRLREDLAVRDTETARLQAEIARLQAQIAARPTGIDATDADALRAEIARLQSTRTATNSSGVSADSLRRSLAVIEAENARAADRAAADVAALRAEVDRLDQELATVRADRDRLSGSSGTSTVGMPGTGTITTPGVGVSTGTTTGTTGSTRGPLDQPFTEGRLAISLPGFDHSRLRNVDEVRTVMANALLPVVALEGHGSGDVLVLFVTDVNGNVVRTEISESVTPTVDAVAENIVRTMRITPPQVAGQNAVLRSQVRVRFSR